MKNRFHLLDTIRGIVLVSMIVYHASWNMVYIYGRDWDWYKSDGAYIWQQSICWTFILLSGFCFSLGKRHLKRGLMVFASGALVTLVTMIAMPQNRVVFGVLTCIGSCSLLLTFTEKVWKKVPSEVGMILAFFLFLFTKNVNNGYWGIRGVISGEVPGEWYRNLITAFLGFPHRGFYSTDYFSIIPWLFLFVSGYYLFRQCEKNRILERKVFQKKIPLLTFLGRHSLLIYLLHQPVIYGAQEMFWG